MIYFSALQRAENSSNTRDRLPELVARLFQCSSASRKFLKMPQARVHSGRWAYFSALQRAENSSNDGSVRLYTVWCTFQCSSASRKFLKFVYRNDQPAHTQISVLFSEPKIPQTSEINYPNSLQNYFSALQRAENSSNAGLSIIPSYL